VGRKERRRLQFDQRAVGQNPAQTVGNPQRPLGGQNNSPVPPGGQQSIQQGYRNTSQITVPTVNQLSNAPGQQNDRTSRPRGQSQISNFYQPRLGADGQPLNQVRNMAMGTGIVAAVTPVPDSQLNHTQTGDYAGFCHGCGLVHGGFRHGDPANLVHEGCKFYRQKHPDYNLEPCDWAQSQIGKAYALCNVPHLTSSYVMNRRTGLLMWRRENKRKFTQQSSSSSGDDSSPYPLECPTLPCVLKCRDGSSLAEKVHMDTGAFWRHSLMTEALALKLVSRGSEIVVQPEVAYRPALGGQPLTSKGYLEITIVVAFDTEINDFDTLTNLRFDIVDIIIPALAV